jgi:hypothetical protein
VKSAIRKMPRHVRAHAANANETDVHVITSYSCHVEKSRDISDYFADPPRIE